MTVTQSLIFAGAVTTVKVNGNDIGGTYDGVKIQGNPEWFEMQCDQVNAPVAKSLMSNKGTITLNLAELSLANLRIALAQASTNLTGSTLYMTDDDPGSMTLELICPNPSGVGSKYYYFPLVYNVGTAEHTYKKNEQLFMPVTFDALPDTSNSNRICYIADMA